VRHASKSSGLRHVEASQDSLSQFVSKLAEVQRQMVHMAPSRRGCVESKLKMDGSMRRGTSVTFTLHLPFSMY
jgi:hypothetical protein